MLLRATFCSGLLLSTFMFAPTVWILVILRFISGFFSGTVSPAQALVVTTTPDEHHGFSLGVLSSSVWSGNMIGFMLGGFVVKFWGYNMAFITGAALFFLAGLVTLLLVRENFVPPPPKEKTGKTSSVKIRFHLPDFGAAIYAIFLLFLWMAFARRFDEPYLALLVEKISGLTGQNAAGVTGAISAVAAVGGVLAGIGIGFLSDRSSPRRVIFPAALIGSAAMFTQAFSPNVYVLGAARLVTFFVLGGLEPVILSMLSRETPGEKRGTVFGLVASIRITGLLIGASLGGVVIYLAGIRSVFSVGAVAILFLIPLLVIVERVVDRTHRRQAGSRGTA